MKLSDAELDELLNEAGLRLDQAYNARCSYRKTEWLHTACLACGMKADYRLAYILDKNSIGEKTCRACYLREWHRSDEDIRYTSGVNLVEAKQRLVAEGLMEPPADMSEGEARSLAERNGYELVDLLRGARPRRAAARRPMRCLRETVCSASRGRRIRLHLCEVEKVA